MKYNWGAGIPKYDESDIITEKELLDFAMQNVREFELQKNGWKIVSESNNLDDCPNFVVTKDGAKYFILVKASIAPEMPTLSDDEKNIMIEYSTSNNAIPLFAPVGFGSTDPERFEKSLALRGDGFYCNYVGLQKIENDVINKDTEIIEENEEELENMENTNEEPITEKEYKIKIEDKELTKEIMQKFLKKYNFEKRTSMAELRVGATPDDGQVYIRNEVFTGCNFFFKFEGKYLIIKLDNKGAHVAYPLNEKNIRLVDNLVIDIKASNGYDVNKLPSKHDVSDIEGSKKNKTGFFSRIFEKK